MAGSSYFLCLLLRLSQAWAAAIASFVTLFQVMISGAGIPVLRAGAMACLAFIAIIIKREVKPLNLFFFAVFVLLLMDAKSLWSISFQLSFVSVFSLMVLGLWKIHWSWADCFKSSLTVLIGTLPLVLYYFNIFSPMGLIANVFAVPFFHLALLFAFGALAVDPLPLMPKILAVLSDFFLGLGIKWIHLLSLPRWGYFFFSSPTMLQIGLYYSFLGAAIACKIRNFLQGFYFFFICFLICLSTLFIPKSTPEFELTLFSIGQNESAALHMGKSTWLINSGRRFPSNQADWTINPYLRSKGIQKLEAILLTDEKKKHTGGIETLTRDFEVEDIVYLDLNEKPIIEMNYKGIHFIWLNDLNETVLQEVRPFKKQPNVLILPAISKYKEKYVEPIIKTLNPKTTTIFGRKPEGVDLPILDTKTYGAVTFKYEKGTLTRTSSRPLPMGEVNETGAV